MQPIDIVRLVYDGAPVIQSPDERFTRRHEARLLEWSLLELRDVLRSLGDAVQVAERRGALDAELRARLARELEVTQSDLVAVAHRWLTAGRSDP